MGLSPAVCCTGRVHTGLLLYFSCLAFNFQWDCGPDLTPSSFGSRNQVCMATDLMFQVLLHFTFTVDLSLHVLEQVYIIFKV